MPPSDSLKGFPGFAAGRTRLIPVPSDFFGEVLPKVDDLNELKAILYAIWRLAQSEGDTRYVRLEDALIDLLFLEGMQAAEGEAGQAARDAFARAAHRGVLIEITVKRGARTELWYLLNSEKGREAMARLQRGDFAGLLHDIDDGVVGLEKERPNVFLLYEQNIGMVTPMLADRLREAERDYPENWIRDAFSLAVDRNKRNWAYINGILKEWAEHGKDTPGQSGRSLAGGASPAAGDDEPKSFVLE